LCLFIRSLNTNNKKIRCENLNKEECEENLREIPEKRKLEQEEGGRKLANLGVDSFYQTTIDF